VNIAKFVPKRKPVPAAGWTEPTADDRATLLPRQQERLSDRWMDRQGAAVLGLDVA
jgi:hypothetical protein